MTATNIKFPSKAKLKAMDEKLKNAPGTLMVGPSSTPAEKFRWELCQRLVKFMVEKGMSQVDFAEFLAIDQARVSEITNHRIDKVSTDKLLSYNEKINPGIEFKIAK
jgi:predicted XRE-type DNA-binding protein